MLVASVLADIVRVCLKHQKTKCNWPFSKSTSTETQSQLFILKTEKKVLPMGCEIKKFHFFTTECPYLDTMWSQDCTKFFVN